MNVCESLTATARIVPDNIALIYEGKSLSYRDLDAQSQYAAQTLAAMGVEVGDRVAIVLPNSPAFPIWYYGALRIGAIVVSISNRLASDEIEFVLSDSTSSVLVHCDSVDWNSEEHLHESLKAVFNVDLSTGMHTDQVSGNDRVTNQSRWFDADPDDPAVILYTSGTTGFPKGAVLSHRNVRSNVAAFNHLCNMQVIDRVLLAVPLFHCFGQNALLNSVLNVGGTLVLQKRFDLNETKSLIREYQVSQLYGVPMMFGLLWESCSQEDLASVTYCFSAAAPLPIQTSLAWQEKFELPIFEGYGLTETSPFATYNHRVDYRAGSIGTGIDGVEIKIFDTESGKECLPDELGEIAIRGPNVMLGYWNRPEETSEAIRDGWFFSGDIGKLDASGYLYIVDRVKDMIAVGGLKVFPAEVERIILDHESVVECAVFGIPDAVLGEQVVGAVVLKDGLDGSKVIAEVFALANERLGEYKVPRRIELIDELPRNPSGKVLKTELRNWAASWSDSSALNVEGQSKIVESQTQLKALLSGCFESQKFDVALDYVKAMVVQVGKLDDNPESDASFIDLGMDSLGLVELTSCVQREVGTKQELPPTILFDYPRITDLAGFLVGLIDESQTVAVKDLDGMAERYKPTSSVELVDEVSRMSEDEALEELMRELDD